MRRCEEVASSWLSARRSRYNKLHVDEAMHRSLVDLELTLNLDLSEVIVVK